MKKDTYIFSSIFCSKNAKCIPQDYENNFEKWFISPNNNKEVVIPKNVMRLSRFLLPKGLDDSGIQSLIKFTPLTEVQLIDSFYGLIIEPKIGQELFGQELKKDEKYIVHCYIDGILRSVRINWNETYWYFYASRFDGTGKSSGLGEVLLYTT